MAWAALCALLIPWGEGKALPVWVGGGRDLGGGRTWTGGQRIRCPGRQRRRPEGRLAIRGTRASHLQPEESEKPGRWRTAGAGVSERDPWTLWGRPGAAGRTGRLSALRGVSFGAATPSFSWPVSFLIAWFASGWLDGWMVGCLDGWMVGWLAGWLVGSVGWSAVLVA